MKTLKFLVLTLFVASIVSCEEPLEYKYQDKPQLVDCPGADKALMHEALYSFQEDIAAYYNKHSDYAKGSSNYYVEAYMKFVYFGFSGEAKFDEIVSPHSLQLLKKLKQIDGLWTTGNAKSNLNYHHEYVSCLFENITDEDVKARLLSLLKVNYLSPEMVAEPMREDVQKIVNDSYLAMYMMLDAYYQYLINYDLPESK
ncbi:MAG: hypothetical protein R2776_03855 [Flavobacteriaceae bacterium]|nr:hypothetical protein [Flavobacteriaceae bacterium]